MRNWNQYLKLWQQKRNELHVGSDMQADWSDMHQLLDKHMPLNTPPADGGNAGHGSAGSGSSTGANLLNLAKFKLLYVVAGLIIGSAITYIAISNINQKTDNRYKKNKTEIRKDSPQAGNVLKTDSLNENATENLKNGQKNPSAVNAGSNSSSAIANPNKPADNKIIKDHSMDISVGADAAKPADEKSNGTSSGKTGRDNKGDVKNTHLLTSPSAVIKNGILSGNGVIRRSNDRRFERQSGSHHQYNQQNTLSQNHSRQINNGNKLNVNSSAPTLKAITPPSALTWDAVVANNQATANNFADAIANSSMLATANTNRIATSGKNSSTNKTSANKSDKKVKHSKVKPARNPAYGNLDWGLLAGADGMGSLTPKSQNHNIYGSLPIDIYVGLFGTYNLNDRWAIGLQSRFLVPHTVSGRYSYSRLVKKDTAQTTETIQISDSRKVYTVDVPIHLIYNINPNIHLKGGPMLSIPVKTANGTYPNPGNDSTGNANAVTKSLSATAPARKVLFGASAGIGFSYKFLWLDATYNYNPGPMKMKSDLGGYSSNTNSLQLTIGIKLNKSKK